MAKKDVASFPRADTDIIKSEDMIAALPVPRSSSEVIKPSELFLDLMMLDPLKTKEVSETAKPSTAPRAEASPKHLPPACSAPPVTQPAIASALPAAQGPSLASQMVANATAATASMPFCQAAPFYSIPEGPRISPAPVVSGGYGYTMVVNGREFSMRPQYNVVQMSQSTQLPPAQPLYSKALAATTSSYSQPSVQGAVADGAAGVQSVNQTKSLPSRTYTTQVVVTPPAQASMALPVRSPATSSRITGSVQVRPSRPSQPSQPSQWAASPGAFAVTRIASNAAYPLQTTVAPRPTVSMLLPARTAPSAPWPLRPAGPAATAPQPWPMAMPFDGRTAMPLATPQRFGVPYPSPGAIVMPPVRSPSQGHSMAQTVAMNAQARFPLSI